LADTVPGTSTNYIHNGLTASTRYFYAITAVNSAGESKKSYNAPFDTALTDSPPPKPSTPSGVKATAQSSTSIKISWTAVTGATSYNIYSPETAGSSSNFVLLDTVTTTSYTDTYPSAGETWYYKVSAVNDSGESAQSSAVSAKTSGGGTSSGGTSGGGTGGGGTTVSKPNAPYGAPAIKAHTPTSTTLEWSASLGATSYKLYRATDASGPFGEVYSDTATTYKDTGVNSSTTYYYKVTAVNSAGESGYSDVKEWMPY
jgi:fibronectin type 3 domain-containing protein